MPEAIITYFSEKAKVCCDGKCNKAWGINNRPRFYLDINNHADFQWLADAELGEAPADPGTYEGSDGKPKSVSEFPNKWCVRECERCNMSGPGKSDEPLEIISFDKRRKP